MVFALAGDSTITKDLLILASPHPVKFIDQINNESVFALYKREKNGELQIFSYTIRQFF